jgi:DNA-binding beta-propeller fold protein YncE
MKKLPFLLCTVGVSLLMSCKKTAVNNITTADSIITIAGGNGQGSAANQFSNAAAIYIDRNKNLYVADAGNNRIQKFPPGSTSDSNGITIAGGNGNVIYIAANTLLEPSGVFVDSNGYVYVTDAGANRIQKFPPGSTSSTNAVTVAGGSGYVPGSGANELAEPGSLFVDDSGNVYVADCANERIQKFLSGSTSATNGITVAGGNGYGSAANQLGIPHGIFVDKSGNLYVADAGVGSIGSRIQKFPPGSTGATNGVTVAGGNGEGSAENQFYLALGIFVDSSGNIYVADGGGANNRIQKFPPGSTSATAAITVAGGNGYGSATNQFWNPVAVYVDDKGNIYVLDQANNRVQEWIK